MFKHLIITSLLLNLISCDGKPEKPKKSAQVKQVLTISKPASQTEININMPLLETISEKTIQPLNLQITSEMMETMIDSDEDVLEHATDKTELFRTKSVKEQDRVNMSFELYYDEDETDYLNIETIEGGRLEIKLIH